MSHTFETYLIICLLFTISAALPTKNKKDVPPDPEFNGPSDGKVNNQEISKLVREWTPEDGTYVWELSGLYQGDIMESGSPEKNGLLDEATRWPDAIVPYYIEENDFSKDDIELIEKAFKEFHEKTCVRFRPYKDDDKHFIYVRGQKSGCWSQVGKQSKGQMINFENPICLTFGTIIHELMHAIGFYHQQSATDRDEWVTILWDNIDSDEKYNFEKMNDTTVTDFGIEYDYGSVMHYSSFAFSNNGFMTIVPTKPNVTLGQRAGFSKKDIQKVNAMYESICEARDEKEKETYGSGNVLDIIASLWPFADSSY